MTTIVIRDGVLAADRLVTKNDVSIGQAGKIREVRNPDGDLLGWFACCGWPTDSLVAVKWLSKWPDLADAPKRFQDCDASGFFLLRSGEVWTLSGSEPFQTEAEFHACGSGWEVAMGALAMGASAERAVEIASDYDQGTGGGVDKVEVG